MGRHGKHNRLAAPVRVRLYFRPLPDDAPKYWPKDADDGGLRWASVMAGGDGWVFGDGDVLNGRELRDARMLFDAEYEAEFREEHV